MNRFFKVLLVVVFSISCSIAFGIDSLSVKERDGKKFILHQVEQGETLYRLSKRYGVTVQSIEEANKELLKEGMKAGQIVWVPYKGSAGATASANNNNETGKQAIYHKVKQGETLYAISRKYKVSDQEIKKWNGMKDNTLSIDQEIIVGYKAGTTTTEPVKTDVKEVRSPGGYVKVVEKGRARLMGDEKYDIQYYAYHSTAPVGTIMIVENPENNATIYVRVMGKLKETVYNNNFIIELSQPAIDKLGVKSDAFEVVLSYPKDK